MKTFNLASPCPTCGLVSPKGNHSVKSCAARADEVPLRCVYAANPSEVLPTELYHQDGNVYRPVTKIVRVEDDVTVYDLPPEDAPPGTPSTPRMAKVQRDEKVIDLEATLAAGPATLPRTIAHVHRRCSICGAEWAEALAA